MGSDSGLDSEDCLGFPLYVRRKVDVKNRGLCNAATARLAAVKEKPRMQREARLTEGSVLQGTETRTNSGVVNLVSLTQVDPALGEKKVNLRLLSTISAQAHLRLQKGLQCLVLYQLGQ